MARILIVDDDPDTRGAVVAALSGPEREIRTAADGDEALAVARSFAPHVVVTDVSMPKRSGFELAVALAERRSTALASIIFVTALDSLEQRIHGLRLGAVDYLTKPFAIEELSLRVDNALRASLRAHDLYEHALAGSLSRLGLATLLNVLALERKTGELELTSETSEARVLVREGSVIAASGTGSTSAGAPCVYELLRWQTGRFAFRERPVVEPDEIRMSTIALLLEGARRTDEDRRDA